MKFEKIELQSCGDDRGSLVALEEGRNVPFSIKRVYYIFETKNNVVRGLHAHKNLRQLVVAVKGSCKFLLDDGEKRVVTVLNNPAEGLLVESMIWREMYDFTADCVLMVLADSAYDESDYIREYDDFIKECRKK